MHINKLALSMKHVETLKKLRTKVSLPRDQQPFDRLKKTNSNIAPVKVKKANTLTKG